MDGTGTPERGQRRFSSLVVYEHAMGFMIAFWVTREDVWDDIPLYSQRDAYNRLWKLWADGEVSIFQFYKLHPLIDSSDLPEQSRDTLACFLKRTKPLIGPGECNAVSLRVQLNPRRAA